MKLSQVAPELRPALRRTPQFPFGRAWARHLARTLIRFMPARAVAGVRLELPADAPPGLRVYHPGKRRTDAALLWIHGGGYVIGAPAQDDHLCSSTANELGMTVVSAGYRLAPEHPFPIPLDDCQRGWDWLQAHAETLDVDPARVVIGGQSAGAGLAACLAQRLHDAPGRPPLAQWLFGPMLDDRTAARPELDEVGHRVWNNRLNRYGWRSYLGAEPGSAVLPPYAVAARREDLGGLPPAWIGVGDIDLFHDEDQAYAQRLNAAGVDATFRTVAGAPHGFEAWGSGTALTRGFISGAQAWLGQVSEGDRESS